MNLKGKMLNFKAFCVEFAEKIKFFDKKGLNLMLNLGIFNFKSPFFTPIQTAFARKNPC